MGGLSSKTAQDRESTFYKPNGVYKTCLWDEKVRRPVPLPHPRLCACHHRLPLIRGSNGGRCAGGEEAHSEQAPGSAVPAARRRRCGLRRVPHLLHELLGGESHRLLQQTHLFRYSPTSPLLWSVCVRVCADDIAGVPAECFLQIRKPDAPGTLYVPSSLERRQQ